MKILVLGSGWMGSAAVYDLVHFGSLPTIGIADQDEEQLAAAEKLVSTGLELHQIDCSDDRAVTDLFREYDIVVSAVPYRFNVGLTAIAIETQTHLLDLGGNSDIVRKQIGMHDRASAAGITVIPNCGLAPGLSNILAMTGLRKFDNVTSIKARVGGLPQHPRPPLKYQLVFSVEGLINEYVEPAEVINDSEIQNVPSLSGLESLSFGSDFPELEAFYTSGGLSLLPEKLAGKVKHLSYKTIRYPGHCEKFRTLLDIGFGGNEPVIVGGGVHTSRELFAELLRKKLAGTDEDVVLFRVDITGEYKGEQQTLRYEMIDRYDPLTKMTAMMRTTAYPTTAIALMLADRLITQRGAYLPEEVVDGDLLIHELRERNIEIGTQFLTENIEVQNDNM